MNVRKTNSEIASFANEIYESFYRDITDQLFLYIQHNNDLLQKYNLLKEKYTKDTLIKI